MHTKIRTFHNALGENKGLAIYFKDRQELDDLLDIGRSIVKAEDEYFRKKGYASDLSDFFDLLDKTYREIGHGDDRYCYSLIFSNQFEKVFWALYNSILLFDTCNLDLTCIRHTLDRLAGLTDDCLDLKKELLVMKQVDESLPDADENCNDNDADINIDGVKDVEI